MLLREALGQALRERRQAQQRTLRDVAGTARVALGYLSELERGRKEASSELLASVCAALGVPVPVLLADVTRRLAAAHGLVPLPARPQSVPARPAA